MIYLYLLYTYWSFFYHNMRPIGDIPFAQEMERLKPGNLVLGQGPLDSHRVVGLFCKLGFLPVFPLFWDQPSPSDLSEHYLEKVTSRKSSRKKRQRKQDDENPDGSVEDPLEAVEEVEANALAGAAKFPRRSARQNRTRPRQP